MTLQLADSQPLELGAPRSPPSPPSPRTLPPPINQSLLVADVPHAVNEAPVVSQQKSALEEKVQENHASKTSIPKASTPDKPVQQKSAKRKRVLDPNREISEDECVFVVRATGELIRDYDRYLERVKELRLRKYECSVSGKTNLTYEESLAADRKAKKQLQRFPDRFLPDFVKSVQHSTLSLSELVDKLYCEFNGHVTKTVLRLKIKDCAERVHSTGAPWIVSSDLADKFDAATQLPPELQEIVDAAKSGKPRRRKSKSSEVLKESDAKHGTSPVKKAKTSSPAPPPEPKYPIEDTKLPSYSAVKAPDLNLAPEWTQDPTFSIFGDVLMPYHFLNHFGGVVRLSSFSFDMWLDALSDSTRHPLLEEVLLSLLELIRRGSEHGIQLGKKELNELDVDLLLCTLESLQDQFEMFDEKVDGIQDIEPGLATTRQLYSLHSRHKARLVRILCDMVLSTAEIRDKLDRDVISRHELRVASRAQKIEDRKEIREQRRIIKEERVKMLPSKNSSSGSGIPNAEAETKASTIDASAEQFSKNKKKSAPKAKEEVLFEASPSKSRREVLAEQKRRRLQEEADRKQELEQEKAWSRVRNMERQCNQEEQKRDEIRDRSLHETLARLSIRLMPLGLDRYHRSYYWIPDTDGRVIVSCPQDGLWGWYSNASEVSELFEFLNEKGIREQALKRALAPLRSIICGEMLAHEKKELQLLRAKSMPKRNTRACSRRADVDEDVYVNKYRLQES